MSSYFKIVQTSNKGKFELCAIPSAWGLNGTLKWPPVDSKKSKAALKATANLLEDANSVPGSDWREFKCILKRTNIPTIEVAEAEIDVMMRESDTSSNESNTKKMPPPSTKSGRPPKRQVTTIVSNRNADSDRNNFNCVAASLTGSISSAIQTPSNTINHQQQHFFTNPTSISSSQQHHTDSMQFYHSTPSPHQILQSQQQLLSTVPQQTRQPSNFLYMATPAAQQANNNYATVLNADGSSSAWTSSSLPAHVTYEDESVETMAGAESVDISGLVAVLRTLAEEIATLHIKVDNLDKKMDKLVTNKLVASQSSATVALDEVFSKIDSDEKLEKFDDELKTDAAYASDLYENLKGYCGENSMKGDSAAYALIDVFFARHLLTEYSWGGGTKKGYAPKKPFKKFEYIFRIFFQLVKRADPSYSEVEMKNFFQNKLLPNSARRNGPVKRAPRAKSRAKLGTTQKKKGDHCIQTMTNNNEYDGLNFEGDVDEKIEVNNTEDIVGSFVAETPAMPANNISIISVPSSHNSIHNKDGTIFGSDGVDIANEETISIVSAPPPHISINNKENENSVYHNGGTVNEQTISIISVPSIHSSINKDDGIDTVNNNSRELGESFESTESSSSGSYDDAMPGVDVDLDTDEIEDQIQMARIRKMRRYVGMIDGANNNIEVNGIRRKRKPTVEDWRESDMTDSTEFNAAKRQKRMMRRKKQTNLL